MTRGEFIQYLTETLIPDLRESGMDATADDFQTCADIITMDGLYMNGLGISLQQRVRQ